MIERAGGSDNVDGGMRMHKRRRKIDSLENPFVLGVYIEVSRTGKPTV